MDRSILAVLLRRYGKHSSINATILNNRGCYGTCSFCSVKKLSGNAARCFRQRSMENLVDEILSIVKNYKVRDFYFCSPTFLPYKSFGEKHAEKFNMLLREKGLDISFFAYLRTDGISRKVVKELKMSGMKTLFLGIESFDDKVLRAMKKNATAKQNIEALEILHKAGYSCEYDSDFRLKIGLITFYPGINMDILKKHIKYVRKYRIPAKKLTYSYEVHDEKDLGFAGQANKKIYRKEIDEAGIEELRRAYIDFFSTLTPYLEKIRSLQKSCNNINEESNRSLYALLRSMNDLAYDLFEKLCECKTNSEMQALVRQSNDAVSDLAEKTDSEIIRIIDHNGKAMRKMYDYRLDRAVNNPQLN
jgi:hypothetical protein